MTSGLQTPVLFVLAADLAELQLNVQVDEADIGSVREGPEAAFRVDALPQQTFTSRVLAVKNMPTAGSNVVTYEVLFGFLPARKAARLNPIEALRHE